MQVSVESTGGLQRKLTVAVSEDVIDQAVQSRLQNLTRTAKIKGFRAGKVPIKVVKQHYGSKVRQEVLGEVLQSSFYEAVSKEKLRPAGNPSFDAQQAEPGKGLEYTAVFEVYPEIRLAELSGETIQKPAVEISETELNAMIDNIRQQQVEWDVVDKPAAEGDRVTIDFKGMIDGEVFDGGEGQDMPVELGKGRMIKGFEDGLLGVNANDEKVLELTFPDEYHAQDLAGKDVQFVVQVKKVESAKLPEVDAEFAKRLGVADGDIAKMRDDVKANMQRELDTTLKNKTKQIVMDKLLEVNNIEVPVALADTESQNLMNQMRNNLVNQGMKPEQVTLEPSMFKAQAERRVALGLLMSEIVNSQKMTADADKVRSFVQDVANSYEKPEEVLAWYYGDKQRLGEVESLVLEEQVVDWVLGQVSVEEQKQSFNELMYPEQK